MAGVIDFRVDSRVVLVIASIGGGSLLTQGFNFALSTVTSAAIAAPCRECLDTAVNTRKFQLVDTAYGIHSAQSASHITATGAVCLVAFTGVLY